MTETSNEMLDELSQLAERAESIAVGRLDVDVVLARINKGVDFEKAAVASDGSVAQGDLAAAFDKMTGELRKLTV